MLDPSEHNKIVIYTKTGCPWCIDALAFLKEAKIDFEERNVTDNADYMIELENKTAQTFCPTLCIGEECFPDTDKDAIKAVLEEKGLL